VNVWNAVIKGNRMVCLLLLCVLVSATFTGCAGGSSQKTSEESETKPPAIEKAVEEKTEPQNEATESTESPKETAMNVVDMPNQIVITTEMAQQGVKPPNAVPDDIPILENAKNLTAIKMGDGINPGDPYYLVQFEVEESVQKTGERYREILKENGFDIVAESELDGLPAFQVNTESWEVTVKIIGLNGTKVWINYVKK